MSDREPSTIDLSRLPPQLKFLVREIGLVATIKLVRARGGQQVWLPKKATGDRVLAQVIGREALAKLVAHRGGERLELPKADKILVQMRDRALFARREAGATESELARDYGITRRWVYEICARLRQERAEAERQGQLFDACANGDAGPY